VDFGKSLGWLIQVLAVERNIAPCSYLGIWRHLWYLPPAIVFFHDSKTLQTRVRHDPQRRSTGGY
jgi:hypothetical protein